MGLSSLMSRLLHQGNLSGPIGAGMARLPGAINLDLSKGTALPFLRPSFTDLENKPALFQSWYPTKPGECGSLIFG